MLSIPRWAAVAASLLLLAPSTIAIPTPGDAELKLDARDPVPYNHWHWVATWTSMPQLVESSNMPPSGFVRANSYTLNLDYP
jgi:hypothetical protein